MKAKPWILGGAAVLLVGCAIAVALAVPAVSATGGQTAHAAQASVEADFRSQWQYTKADEKFAKEAMRGGYETLPLAQFNSRLVDWRDEEAFHKGEQRMDRLLATYPSDQPNAAFINTTLRASFQELSTHHYGGSCTQMTPSYWQSVTHEEKADVFGDAVTVMTAEASFELQYRIADEGAVTVGQRDGIFRAYDEAVQACLDDKTERELLNQKSMSAAITKELKRLNKALSSDKFTLTATLSDYYADDYRG